ncbi:MAG TPA: hypothetical protein VG125_25760 [Pirellulales bacterium]|jgi:hypothetical protein|nr:hypothetical protein [Pirellulales bacterium]
MISPLRTILFFLWALPATGAPATSRGAEPATKPNVIFILADDLEPTHAPPPCKPPETA